MGIFPILQWRPGYSEIFNYPSQKKSSSTKNLPQVCMLLNLFHSYHCTDRIGEGINELNTFGATTHAMKWSWTVSSVQLLSHVQLFETPWTAARQASLSITNSQSLLKVISIESVMASNHLILCQALLLLPSIFPSIRVFSNESVLLIRWPKD